MLNTNSGKTRPQQINKFLAKKLVRKMWRDNRTPKERQKPTTEILEKISFSMHPGLWASSMNDWSTQLYSNSAEEGALLEIPCLELPPTGARPP